LLYDRNGKRRFLVSIACEGGLPLRLLQRDSAKLKQFFIALLEDYHRAGRRDRDFAEVCARKQALKLPRTLHQDVVFRLGGDLIFKIIELQEEIGDAPDPIAALDQQKPKWRSELPLNAEDQTVEALLGGLVRRSGELTRAAKTGLRWRGWLTWFGTAGILEKNLEFPDALTAAQIRAFTGLSELPARLRLLLHTAHGTEAVARLTLSGGSGDDASFRREWLRRGGVKIGGISVTEAHRLVLHDDRQEYEIPIRSGEAWGEPPWVFVARNGSDPMEWLTEGSARIRADEAWVLAAPDSVPIPFEGASCQSMGEIGELGRKVYRVTGGADFITPDQDRYRIECRADTDSICQYVIRGERVAEALNDAPVYRGLPRIEALGEEDQRLPEWTATQQWKPVGIPSGWNPGAIDSSGALWIRCLDPDTRIERFRRQVFVVPRRFRIERTIGHTTTPGGYRLYGLGGASVRVVSPPEARLEVSEDGDGIRIECPVLSVTALPELRLDLLSDGGSCLELRLPYPQRGASFRLGGRVLRRGDGVPLDRLGGLRLLIQDHAGSSRFWLDARLVTDAGESPQVMGSFRERLPMLTEGKLDLGLYAWNDRIASMLASCSQRDASVRLEIASSHQEILVSIHIARFDLAFEPDREKGCVSIPPDLLPRLEAGWESRVRLEMIRLWAPGEDATGLEACPEHPATWLIPTGLEAGPWWVIGRDAGWARFRPLLWMARSDGELLAEAPEPTPSLASAIRLDPQQRKRLMPVILEELGRSPKHPDWPLLFEYLKLTREFPPSTLDVLNRLIEHPGTLAMALLMADEESFERVWALAESMPFSWGLVPVRAWGKAATCYFQNLLAALAGMETGGDIVFGIFQGFRERTTGRRDYWRPLCDWLQERIFPDQPAPLNSELRMARLAKARVESQIGCAEQELQGRHDAEETWPESPLVMEFSQVANFRWAGRYKRLSYPFQAVRYAPFVVAHISLNGVETEPALIYELRLLRHFDPEWFDTAYVMALTLSLADLPPENSPWLSPNLFTPR
jgi:hypothetical protein